KIMQGQSKRLDQVGAGNTVTSILKSLNNVLFATLRVEGENVRNRSVANISPVGLRLKRVNRGCSALRCRVKMSSGRKKRSVRHENASKKRNATTNPQPGG